MKYKSRLSWRSAFTFFIHYLLLLMRRGKKVLVFELASIGELQFFQNILLACVERFPEHLVYIAHNGETLAEFKIKLPQLNGRVRHIHRFILDLGTISKIDLFFTTEQYLLGLAGIYSICLFHGQPSKGLTFSKQILFSFDAFFLYGPIHRQTFEEFLVRNKINRPSHLKLFEIGYSKSDELIQNRFDRASILQELGLSQDFKTIIYAPAFNEGASLHIFGVEIIEILTKMKGFNVIVKLPIDCYDETNGYFKTSGINWPLKLRELEKKNSNFKLYDEYFIDPVLACSDVLVTCVSSVSFEFIALKKPVIFIHTPIFYNSYLKERFPHDDTSEWVENTTINAGREFGLVINEIKELPSAIQQVLSIPFNPNRYSNLPDALLFNPGKATEAIINKIEELLQSHVHSLRPYLHVSPLVALFSKLMKRLVNRLKKHIQRILYKQGYKIEKLGTGYLDVYKLAKLAQKDNMSLYEYLEFHEDHYKKVGRRDRIIIKMSELGLFENCKRVCEIGVGTGRYLEKVLELAKPDIYDIYETELTIKKYLKETYKNPGLIFHECDGRTLSKTPSNSCDLVHAHAVFVYIPILLTFEYLLECVRVCKPSGHIVFDCFLDDSFDLQKIRTWLYSKQDYPVIIPKKILSEFAQSYSLKLILEFKEIYSASHSNYFIFQKS